MRWGLGKPINDIDMSEEDIVHHYFFDLWIDMWFYTFSVGLSKFVILGFYWRTFSLSIIRQPIRILFVCSVCWVIVRVSIFPASPPKKSVLTSEGYSYHDAVSANREVLAAELTWEMSSHAHDVVVRSEYTALLA